MNIVNIKNRFAKVEAGYKGNPPTMEQINARFIDLGFDPQQEWAWVTEHARTRANIEQRAADHMGIPLEVVIHDYRVTQL